MNNRTVTVVVNQDAAAAVTLADALREQGLEVVVCDRLVAAVGAMRRYSVGAIVANVPAGAFAIAESYLRADEELPPCVVLSDNKPPRRMRSRGVAALDTAAPAATIAAAVQRMTAMQVPEDRYRALPLRPAFAIAKWTNWFAFA